MPGPPPAKPPASQQARLKRQVEELTARLEQLEKRLAGVPPDRDGPLVFERAPRNGDRADLQRFFGELHGVLHSAVQLTGLPDDDRESLLAAYREVSVDFGRTQAALNSGDYEGEPSEQGLGGEQLRHKLRRWWKGVSAFVRDGTPEAALKALRAGRVVVGTAATMVGAAEPIKELAESVSEVLAERR
jgi:hypothetical protein